jgi:integrase
MATDDDPPAGAGGSEPVGDRVRIYRRGATWYANFQHDGRQHRPSLKTTSKKEARRRALRIEADLAAGAGFGAPPPPTRVADVIAAYTDFLRTEDRAPKTLAKYAMVFARVAALAAARRVRDVSGLDRSFVDAYRRQRADAGAAPKTRHTETVIVRQLVNFALSRDLIAADPLKGLKLKKPQPTPQPCWTHAEVGRILAASPPEIRPGLTLLAETGMRFGELAWLTWADVDPAANLLRIQPTDGWKPKTGDQRAVPLTPTAAGVLAGLPRRFRWVVTLPPSARCREAGRPWTERRLLAALKRVLAAVGLPGKLHTFRHTFISNALVKGVPVAVVKEWVGHVDDEIIRHYTHVHNDASQAAMRRLAEANEAPTGGANGRGIAGGGSAQNQHSDGGRDNDPNAK